MQFKQEIISYLLIWFPYSRKVQKGEKKKRHGKNPQTPGFAGKGEGLGADPLRRRFLSCSIASGLKEPREKKTPGWKASPANTKQRRRSPWTQRGKQINKQEITFSSLPLQLLRHQEFTFQHSVIETTGHAGLKGKAGTGELK